MTYAVIMIFQVHVGVEEMSDGENEIYKLQVTLRVFLLIKLIRKKKSNDISKTKVGI